METQNGAEEFIYRRMEKQWRNSNGETDIENRFMDMRRAEQKVRCIESVTWKFMLPYVK